MRSAPWILAAMAVVWALPCPAADVLSLAFQPVPVPGPSVDGLQPPQDAGRDLERLAASRATWEKARDAAGGNYSYEVLQITLVSRQTTRIVVRQGKVVERSFEQSISVPRAVEPGRPAPAPKKTWTETGDEIGSHGDGAAPPRTVEELYDEAAKLLAAPRAEFRERSLGIDDRGFLNHCFERDSRIADDAPLEGVKPFRITIGTP